jgi:hypothetical protein
MILKILGVLLKIIDFLLSVLGSFTLLLLIFGNHVYLKNGITFKTWIINLIK